MNNLNFRDKIELLITIRTLRAKSVSWETVFKDLKLKKKIPERWNKAEQIRKFYSRCKNLLDEYEQNLETEFDVYEFIRPILKDIEITEREKFNIHWTRLTDKGKTEFLDWLAYAYMKKGIPMAEVCSKMVEDFKKIQLLDATRIRDYISNKYKNLDYQKRKLGKTPIG